MIRLLAAILTLTALSVTASERLALLEQVQTRGKALHEKVETLRKSAQKHPSKFKFKGTDAQKKAAYAAQLKRYNEWKSEYDPAIRDRSILAEAYAELRKCSESRAADIKIELSGMIDGQEQKQDAEPARRMHKVVGKYKNRGNGDQYIVLPGYKGQFITSDGKVHTAKWSVLSEGTIRFYSTFGKRYVGVTEDGQLTWGNLARTMKKIDAFRVYEIDRSEYPWMMNHEWEAFSKSANDRQAKMIDTSQSQRIVAGGNRIKSEFSGFSR